MAKPAEIILASLLAAVVPACATDTTGDADVGDHSRLDWLLGRIRMHELSTQQPAIQSAQTAQLVDDAIVKLSDGAITVSSTRWHFEIDDGQILQLASRAAGRGTDIKLTMIDAVESRPLTCRGAGVFTSVSLDPAHDAIVADGNRYTFADCGLTRGAVAIDVFPAPTTDAEGTFSYELDANVL